MTRGRKQWRDRLSIVLGAAALVFFLAASAPLSLIVNLAPLQENGVSLSAVQGTVWRGAIHGLSIRGVSLGDVDLNLSPLSMLTLRPKVSLNAASGQITGRATITAGLGARVRFDDVKLMASAQSLTQQRIMGTPPTGGVDLYLETLSLVRGACAAARGIVSSDILDAAAKRYSGAAFPVSGAITCDGGDIVVALRGDGAPGQATIDLRISPDRVYQVNAVAQPSSAEIVSALLFFGFEQQDDVLVYGSTGVFEGTGS